MPKLPVISAKRIIKILINLNFEITSQKGSHIKLTRYANNAKQVIIVPNHKTMRKGTLKNILREVKISHGDLVHLL